MRIGAMNHPGHDVLAEIEWMADLGLEFVDLTLEPPANGAWQIDPDRVRAALEKRGMGVVGHTAYYIPLASPFEELRCASLNVFRRCLEAFHRIGVKWMNIHPDRWAPFHDRAFFVRRNLETLRELCEHAARLDMGIMIENLPGDFNNAAQLGDLLDPLPQLGLHLDIGHANLRVPHNTTAEILRAWGSRLRHVHLHDNRGGDADLHLPLGAGNLDTPGAVAELKRCGYDGTITLEVFTPDRRHLAYSRDVLRRLWDAR